MCRKILFDIYMILFYPVICRSQFRIRYFGDLYRLSYGMVNAALDRTSRLLRVLMYKCAEDCGLGSKEERTYYEKEKVLYVPVAMSVVDDNGDAWRLRRERTERSGADR